MNYVANFYKNPEHNYSGFFTNYDNSAEVMAVKREVDKIAKELEEKNTQYSTLLAQRYNSSYTPINRNIVLYYTNRDGSRSYFSGATGAVVHSVTDNDICYELGTKSGSVSFVVGYCFPLASVVVRRYKYSIPANNSKLNLKIEGEYIVPMLEGGVCYECDITRTVSDEDSNLDSNMTDISKVSDWNFSCAEALRSMNATEFIQGFYDIDKKFDFTLYKLKTTIIKNKSFEIIIKTAPDDILPLFMDMSCDRAVPLHEIIDCSKADFSYAKESGVLKEFCVFKKNINQDKDNPHSLYGSEKFKTLMNKTDKEWIDLIEKMKHSQEDLDFYTVRYNTGYGYGGGLLNTLITSYVGGSHPWYNSPISEFYPFGKYCAYVIEGVINQGYTHIKDFIDLLVDYLNMCKDLGVVPTLYSDYLRQTHDIVSRNHKIMLREEQEKIFKTRYDGFKPVSLEGGSYTLIAPTSSNDLQIEGDNLNHCVASYIKRVVDGECLIYFLRKTEEIETSLVTVEVRNKAIVQAKGLHNRHINANEHKALSEFAARNKMTVRI